MANKSTSTTLDDAVSEDKETEKRPTWSNPAEFILCCLGYAVGLGNVWRFPYMCYENGGGAFLIPYAIMLLNVGLPAFFMELILGQYSGRGPLHVWEVVPILKGIGVGMLFINSMICIFYTMILGYALYYLVLSFFDPLPWDTCQNAFNTQDCYNKGEALPCEEVDNGTWFNQTCYNATYVASYSSNVSHCNTTDCYYYTENLFRDELLNYTEKNISSAEEYFNNGVLKMSPGIEHTGGFVWQLVCALLAGWILCFLCLIRGIKTTGKVVYFTALFPYVVLTILLIYGCTLPGSYDGILFYVTPDWSKLKTSKVWADAASQIFFSLSVGAGGLMTFASYNKFNNNVYRDALIVSIGNCVTSVYAGFAVFAILGYMANIQQKKIPDVVVDGSTLAFVAYPTVMSRMPVPQLWAVLFFVMLITLGLDSLFAGIETNITALTDSFPRLRKNKTWWTLLMCTIFFLLGLSMTTEAGIYWLNVIAYYATGWSLIIVGIVETTAIGWIYGAKKLRNHVREMCGFEIGVHWWILWTINAPICLIGILVFTVIDFKPLAFGPYVLPPWAQTIGWLVALAPAAAIVLYALVVCCGLCRSSDCGKLSHSQRLAKLFRPSVHWGPSILRGQSQQNGAVPEGRAETYLQESSTTDPPAYVNPAYVKSYEPSPNIDPPYVNRDYSKSDDPSPNIDQAYVNPAFSNIISDDRL